MNAPIQRAFFIISDITGYTMFLTRSELDHAQDILKALFDSQLSHISPPMRVSNFQGDAIFMYVPESGVIQEQTLIEMIEGIYFAFSRQLERMRYATTCRCNACANMGSLDLKLFIHYGQFMAQTVGDKEELIGSDVILVHRMLKNHVIEQSSVRAYALFTAAAAEALRLREYVDDLTEHSEEYDYVGKVAMLIQSLDRAWQREIARRRLVVGKDGAWLSFEDTIPATPALTWDYLTQMDLKTRWMGVDMEERTDELGGRSGEGAAFHCAHGDLNIYYDIVDWEPMHHVTFTYRFPGLPDVLLTYLLEPEGEASTRFATYTTAPEGGAPEEVREQLQEAINGYLQGLRPAVQADLAGKSQIALHGAAGSD